LVLVQTGIFLVCRHVGCQAAQVCVAKHTVNNLDNHQQLMIVN
jgi:hypothetical protein